MFRWVRFDGLVILWLAVLSVEMGVSGRAVGDTPSSPPVGAVKSTDRPMGPDREALAAIARPTRWTPDEVDRYVGEIIEVSSRTDHVFENDPQVQMLSEVGPENIAFLFEALGKAAGAADSHVERAIQHVIQDSHRKLLLTYLPFHPRLASIVVARGWQKDAGDVLIDGLRRNIYLTDAWLQAVASLGDDRVPEAVRRYMGSGLNPAAAYRVLKGLDYYRLDEAVHETWRALPVAQSWLLDEFATIAATHGVIDALKRVAHAVESGEVTYRLPDQERALRELLTYEGTPRELATIVLENLDRLSFDARIRRYSVK
jgi:hypothetical protein